MTTLSKLKKELHLIDVYAITTGTILSGGFFLLPGLAAAQAGPAVIISYMLAAVPLIPAILCMIELSTAMPKAGGIYFFFDRSMGPLVGTIGGFGTWLTLILKTAFALIGIGAYLSLFMPGQIELPLAIAFALLFGFLNLVGAKETGKIQVCLTGGILLLLSGFIFNGIFRINASHFSGFFDAGSESIIATAGLVYLSFMGVSKIASVAEEVKNPERNIPLGIFLSLITAFIIYGLGIYVMLGVLPAEKFYGSLTPVATVSEYMMGNAGKILATIAAVFAFSAVTNTGILSASRYPLAMSRDHLLPKFFRRLSKKQIPIYSVVITVAMIILCLVLFNPTKIAKLASVFQLLVFALCCLAVIIMRESKIDSYDPGYKVPLYPWLPIFGFVIPFFLIIEMGWMPILFSSGIISIGALWYFYYGNKYVIRRGAILHIFERLGRKRYEGLEPELRTFIKEKGLREQDPFDSIIVQSQVIDLEERLQFNTIVKKVSKELSKRLSYSSQKIEQEFSSGVKIGATPVSGGVALPHFRTDKIKKSILLMVRAKSGIQLDKGQEYWGKHEPAEQIYAIFFLISPENNPGQHLRILAKIASLAEDDTFMTEWLEANSEQELKNIFLHEERVIYLHICENTKSRVLIGKKLGELYLPEECLITIIRRKNKTIVPRGNSILKIGDSLMIIGDQKGISKVRNLYTE